MRRREFCGLACLGALAACSDGLVPISTGPLGSSPDAPPRELDADIDSAPEATCGPNAVDVGAPSTFQANAPVYVASGNFFVVRDAGGLYALTARCTHEPNTIAVDSQNPTQFRCPRHGALFSFNGAVLLGPASQPLKHFAMCTLANGHVGVDATQTVSASTRLTA